MKSVSVFCGSSSGTDPIYAGEAATLGQTLAERGIELIYGGAKVGLMGAVADGALRAGGKVTGILPYFLQQKEIAHEGLTDLILVESMHERKLKMHELSNGVIALPGGFGTMEELFEMLTWAQLGLHTKPIALLNTGGFYDSLGALMQTMTEKAFLKRTHHDMVIISDHIEELLSKMEAYIAPPSPKWITPRTT